ncbi:MAG: Asp-tRNA(Asn)/Glu-tRNA(Gln) amidotransferase subunit GatC [Legionellales bacterium]|jgi:aspartyl-tRNA(Asn)/glutamyl-tRNA(Gln) amidotransferase subunit C
MSITKEEVGKIAHLARLALSEEETLAYATQLDNIVKLVTVLQNTNTDQIKPMAHPLDAKQRLRPDAITEGNERDMMQAIAPATEMGLYLVPQVIE